MARISKRLAYAFKTAAEAMDWYTGPVWADGMSRIGATFLQRSDHPERVLWRVVRITNEHGGEAGLSGLTNYTTAEMIAWLEGIAYAKRN